jgi:DnaJ-class molecular chaperone
MSYEVLSDPKSREEYDVYLKSAKKDKDYWSWQAGDSDPKSEETKDEDE